MGAYGTQTDAAMGITPSHNSRSPLVAPHQTQGSYGQQFAPSRPPASPAPALVHHSSYGSHSSTHQTSVPPTPQAAPHTSSYNNHYSSASTLPTASVPHTSQTPNPLAAYDTYRSSVPTPTNRAALPIPASSSSNAYNPPRPVEVYHLSDGANASIPADIREQFHRDEHGRVLFFTAPPLDVSPVPEATKKKLGHSLKYLAVKSREKRAPSDESQVTANSAPIKDEKPQLKREMEDVDERTEEIKRLKVHALEVLGSQIQDGTERIYKEMYGDEWKEMLQVEEVGLRIVQAEEAAKKAEIEKRERIREEQKVIKLGRSGL
jgi:chromatin structure-remodeling complex subunit RSC1/2